MIRNLGIKRIAVLLILAGFLGGTAAAYYYYLEPQQVQLDRKVSSAKRQANKLQKDLDRITVQMSTIEEQKEKFEDLEAQGFLSDQNRRETQQILEQVLADSPVVNAVVSVERPSFLPDEVAQRAGHSVMTSPISIQIDAMDDRDIYGYINLIQTRLPGHLSLDSLLITREGEITGAVLRDVAGGGKPVLARAQVDMTWRTLVPDEQGQGR